MKNKVGAPLIALGIFIAALIIFFSATIFVPENKYVCVKRFDKVIEVYDEPGLKFKMPFVDTLVEIPKNAMIYDLQATEVLTVDKKAMIVSSFVIWRIDDPRTYLKTAVTEWEAEKRLDALVYNAVKNLISKLNQTEAISSRGGTLDKDVLSNVKTQMENYGIEVIDTQIKQFDLPADNKEAVYARMISERAQIAAKYTAEGMSEAVMIKNSADKTAALILSSAKADAEKNKALGEREYMSILAEAYSGDEKAEYYEFIRSMDALKKSLTGDKTIVLPLDSSLARWLKGLQ